MPFEFRSMCVSIPCYTCHCLVPWRRMFNELAAPPAEERLGGRTLHLVAGKGDWKWKRDFLREPRHYGRADGVSGAAWLSSRLLKQPFDACRKQEHEPAAMHSESKATRVGMIAHGQTPCAWNEPTEVAEAVISGCLSDMVRLPVAKTCKY